MTKAKIVRARTQIEIPHSEGVLVVAHPFYGPANAKTLKEKINADGLREPTSREVALFAEAMYQGKEREQQEATEIMKKNYLRAFTGILYVPETQLAHFVDFPKFDERSIVDKDDLTRRIEESYAQVPFEHIREELVAWQDVAKHPYILAWAHGQEGAEKLAELASRHPRKEAYLWVPNVANFKQPEARVAALDDVRDGGRLGVNGSGDGDAGGVAFGVRVAEAQA